MCRGVIAVSDWAIEDFHQRLASSEGRVFEGGGVTTDTVEDRESILGAVQPINRSRDFLERARAGAHDHRLPGLHQRFEQRLVHNVRARGFVCVPRERLGDLDQLGAEHRHDRVDVLAVRSLDDACHLVDGEFESAEHLDRIGLSRVLLVRGELRRFAHQAIGLEELELDRICVRVRGGVGELQRPLDIAIVVDADLRDDVGAVVDPDLSITDAHEPLFLSGSRRQRVGRCANRCR